MYRKTQKSGLTEIIPLVGTPAIWASILRLSSRVSSGYDTGVRGGVGERLQGLMANILFL